MILLEKTSFNKNAISNMSFKEFESLYVGIVPEGTDLKKLFTENGGKLKAARAKNSED